MITREKLEELKRLVKLSGERFDFGGLPLPDMFDTIEALWKENEELRNNFRKIWDRVSEIYDDLESR